MIRFLKLFSVACGGLLCASLLAIWFLPEPDLSGGNGNQSSNSSTRSSLGGIGMPRPANSDYRPQEYTDSELWFDDPGLFASSSMLPEAQLFPQPEQLDTELPYSRSFFMAGDPDLWPGSGFSGGGILAGASGGGSGSGAGIAAGSRGGAGANGGRSLLAAADTAELTPVPLPFGLVFFATALVMLGLVTRRQRIPG